MDENNNLDTNDIAEESASKQSLGSRMASGISKANQLRHDYQNAGGLTGMAKNAINDKIHDKIDNKVNAVKGKVKEKINDKKDALKGKINDKIPDSVKQKKAQMDAKKKAVRDKINAPKDKINNMKQQLDDKRKKTNVKAFKSAAREIANAAAPGSGIAVDALLNSEKGKPAVKEAENASNPASAVTKGGKKLIEITVKDQIKKKVFIYITPVVCCAALILILIGSIINKYSDNIEYISKKLLPLISTLNFGGSPDSDTNLNDLSKNTSIDMSNPIYNEFYNNVSDLGGTNKIMVIAVLTSYKNNDEYTTKADYTTDIVQNTDSKQMKAYIKMVADAISESGGDISQGDYSKPGESGSSFFKWLYNDFVEQYYYEYFNTLTKESIPNMKVKLVKAIYDYYELLIKYFPLTESEFSLTTAASCPNGITVTGNNAGTYDLEEYVAGVVASENAYSKNNIIESMKAQAIAARTVALKATSNCTTPIENSTNKQTFKPDRVNSLIKKAVEETSGQVLTFNGELIEAMYDHFKKDECDNEFCYGTYIKIPSNETHKVKVPKSYLTSSGDLGGHGYGMSQVVANYMQDQGSKYDAILKYFYGDGVQISKLVSTINGGLILGAKGIYSASIFPIQDLKSVTVTHGYYYGGDAKKKYHGALDIACNAHNREACIKIPIYAAHSGVVTSISTNYCANSEYENADTTLKRVYKCGGLGVKIKITDKADPYCDYEFWYWHFEKMANNIKPGVKIEAGQFLGNMGSTGSSTGWHLHFQIVNPKGQDLNQNDNIKAFGKASGLKVNNFYPTNALPKY